eukprot:scaffold106040_cov37-Tisochrysis_lutea.AAC.2
MSNEANDSTSSSPQVLLVLVFAGEVTYLRATARVPHTGACLQQKQSRQEDSEWALSSLCTD